MVQKRPFDAEEILEVSFKHPKQEGPRNQFMSFDESVFPEDGCVPTSSVEYPRGAVGSETSFPGGFSVSSWASSDTSEDEQSESPIHLPFEPEYFNPERPTQKLVRKENIYSMLFEHPPTKPVSIGPDHQAAIPAWGSGATSRPNCDAVGDKKDEERLMGTCIIPMPQMELSIYDNVEVGKGRTDNCSCEDRGSMRCVRQHIVEAREELAKTIGNEIFDELGLADMGEQVAEKWSAEEEQLFLKVVFNSPATLDKNFWDYLPVAFPWRSKREMVSYYFNVFMLRRRGEQNRNNLLDIDSDDDDEWQGSGDDNGIETGEDDEDCVTESPGSQDDAFLAKSNCHENYLRGNDEYASDETCAVNENVDFTERKIDNFSRYDPSEMTHFAGLPSLVQPQDQTVWEERFGHDDDSCTSFDARVGSQKTQVKTENDDHWFGNYNGEHNGYSQGHVLDPFDAEVWDSISVLHWK